jgi:hypothetical protein
VAVPSGTAGDDVQLVPVFQLLVAGAGSQVPSTACALTAPRQTLAISVARIVRNPHCASRITRPRAIGIDGLTLPMPAAAGLDQEEGH